jgi:hypothetical protein
MGCESNLDGDVEPYLPNQLMMREGWWIHMGDQFEDDFSIQEMASMAKEEANLLGDFCLLSEKRSRNSPSTTWKRYGTHHGSAAAFVASVASGCVICGSIRAAIPTLSDAHLTELRPFDSGFTTYGAYHFPAWGTCWLVFHLGLSEDGMQVDTEYSVLELLCRPPECE